MVISNEIPSNYSGRFNDAVTPDSLNVKRVEFDAGLKTSRLPEASDKLAMDSIVSRKIEA